MIKGSRVYKLSYIISKALEQDKPLSIIPLGGTSRKVKVGFCCCCGQCCKQIQIKTNVSTHIIEWLSYYGITVSLVDPNYQIEDGTMLTPVTSMFTNALAVLSFPLSCKYLIGPLHDSSYICEIYNQRPKICEYYPMAPNNFDTCTYLFINDNELSEVLNYIKKHKGVKIA